MVLKLFKIMVLCILYKTFFWGERFQMNNEDLILEVYQLLKRIGAALGPKQTLDMVWGVGKRGLLCHSTF